MSATLQGWRPIGLGNIWRCELMWCVLEVERVPGDLWLWTMMLRGGHRVAHGEEMSCEDAAAMAAAVFAAECALESARALKAAQRFGRVQ